MKVVTLAFLLQGDQILLALKKRGFGMGHMNGVGGKIEKGETIEHAAVREAKEEIGVIILEKDLSKVAEIQFNFETRPEWDLYCHVFFVKFWKGEPKETEEMAPQWFLKSKIPFEKMWGDDQYWLPQTIAGTKLKAHFVFSYDGSVVKEHNVVETNSF